MPHQISPLLALHAEAGRCSEKAELCWSKYGSDRAGKDTTTRGVAPRNTLQQSWVTADIQNWCEMPVTTQMTEEESTVLPARGCNHGREKSQREDPGDPYLLGHSLVHGSQHGVQGTCGERSMWQGGYRHPAGWDRQGLCCRRCAAGAVLQGLCCGLATPRQVPVELTGEGRDASGPGQSERAAGLLPRL